MPVSVFSLLQVSLLIPLSPLRTPYRSDCTDTKSSPTRLLQRLPT
jgi:hypothetical protein